MMTVFAGGVATVDSLSSGIVSWIDAPGGVHLAHIVCLMRLSLCCGILTMMSVFVKLCAPCFCQETKDKALYLKDCVVPQLL